MWTLFEFCHLTLVKLLTPSLIKLSPKNLNPYIINWIIIFLGNRKQRVVLDGNIIRLTMSILTEACLRVQSSDLFFSDG